MKKVNDPNLVAFKALYEEYKTVSLYEDQKKAFELEAGKEIDKYLKSLKNPGGKPGTASIATTSITSEMLSNNKITQDIKGGYDSLEAKLKNLTQIIQQYYKANQMILEAFQTLYKEYKVLTDYQMQEFKREAGDEIVNFIQSLKKEESTKQAKNFRHTDITQKHLTDNNIGENLKGDYKSLSEKLNRLTQIIKEYSKVNENTLENIKKIKKIKKEIGEQLVFTEEDKSETGFKEDDLNKILSILNNGADANINDLDTLGKDFNQKFDEYVEYKYPYLWTNIPEDLLILSNLIDRIKNLNKIVSNLNLIEPIKKIDNNELRFSKKISGCNVLQELKNTILDQEITDNSINTFFEKLGIKEMDSTDLIARKSIFIATILMERIIDFIHLKEKIKIPELRGLLEQYQIPTEKVALGKLRGLLLEENKLNIKNNLTRKIFNIERNLRGTEFNDAYQTLLTLISVLDFKNKHKDLKNGVIEELRISALTEAKGEEFYRNTAQYFKETITPIHTKNPRHHAILAICNASLPEELTIEDISKFNEAVKYAKNAILQHQPVENVEIVAGEKRPTGEKKLEQESGKNQNIKHSKPDPSRLSVDSLKGEEGGSFFAGDENLRRRGIIGEAADFPVSKRTDDRNFLKKLVVFDQYLPAFISDVIARAEDIEQGNENNPIPLHSDLESSKMQAREFDKLANFAARLLKADLTGLKFIEEYLDKDKIIIEHLGINHAAYTKLNNLMYEIHDAAIRYLLDGKKNAQEIVNLIDKLKQLLPILYLNSEFKDDTILRFANVLNPHHATVVDLEEAIELVLPIQSARDYAKNMINDYALKEEKIKIEEEHNFERFANNATQKVKGLVTPAYALGLFLDATAIDVPEQMDLVHNDIDGLDHTEKVSIKLQQNPSKLKTALKQAEVMDNKLKPGNIHRTMSLFTSGTSVGSLMHTMHYHGRNILYRPDGWGPSSLFETLFFRTSRSFREISINLDDQNGGSLFKDLTSIKINLPGAQSREIKLYDNHKPDGSCRMLMHAFIRLVDDYHQNPGLRPSSAAQIEVADQLLSHVVKRLTEYVKPRLELLNQDRHNPMKAGVVIAMESLIETFFMWHQLYLINIKLNDPQAKMKNFKTCFTESDELKNPELSVEKLLKSLKEGGTIGDALEPFAKKQKIKMHQNLSAELEKCADHNKPGVHLPKSGPN